jgi:hypothetical protein
MQHEGLCKLVQDDNLKLGKDLILQEGFCGSSHWFHPNSATDKGHHPQIEQQCNNPYVYLCLTSVSQNCWQHKTLISLHTKSVVHAMVVESLVTVIQQMQ